MDTLEEDSRHIGCVFLHTLDEDLDALDEDLDTLDVDFFDNLDSSPVVTHYFRRI